MTATPQRIPAAARQATARVRACPLAHSTRRSSPCRVNLTRPASYSQDAGHSFGEPRMSKELNEGSAGRGVAGHNVENRKQILVNSLAEMWKLDKQIAEANERYIEKLKKGKSAIIKRVREDLTMPAPVFKARYASYKLEAKAIELEDGVTMDAIREMNEMAPVGSQINMLDAVDEFEDPPREEEEEGDDAGNLAEQETVGQA